MSGTDTGASWKKFGLLLQNKGLFVKNRARTRVGRIEKFEDMSLALFLNLKRSAPINCQAPRTIQHYASCDGHAKNTGPEEIINN